MTLKLDTYMHHNSDNGAQHHQTIWQSSTCISESMHSHETPIRKNLNNETQHQQLWRYDMEFSVIVVVTSNFFFESRLDALADHGLQNTEDFEFSLRCCNGYRTYNFCHSTKHHH
jgi:hypothetical protein